MVLAHSSTILAFTLGGLALILLWTQWRKKSRLQYPPGPRPKPIIGNALDIPSEMPWVKYLEWSKQFKSDIIYLSAMGVHIVVLHKLEDITELFEKRSANYSSRPWVPTAQLLGVDNITPLRPYSSEWRKQRLIFHEGLKKETIPLYHRLYTDKVHLFTDLLIREPDNFEDHCKWLSVAITMSMTFGLNIAVGEMKNHYVDLQEQILTATTQLCHPGGTLINSFPILRHVPVWFPGAVTQRRAADVKKIVTMPTDQPFDDVKKSLLAGTSKECVLTRLLHDRLANDGTILEDEDELKDVLISIYMAGTETTQVTQLFFIFAMVLHPLVQRRAQAELDRVVGTDRLPTFDDRPLLPYIDAILRETLRWRTAVPLALPHVTVKDDVYKGLYIPKGALVLANGWAICQDETIFENPEVFNPDRFLNLDGTLKDNTVEVAYGYGRRICPGRFMANDVLWMMMVSVLSTSNISKAKDENGVDIEVDRNVLSSGITCFPCPFKCFIDALQVFG